MIKNATKSKHSTQMKYFIAQNVKCRPRQCSDFCEKSGTMFFFYFWHKSCFTNCTYVRQDIETNTHAQTVISMEMIGFVNIGVRYAVFFIAKPTSFTVHTSDLVHLSTGAQSPTLRYAIISQYNFPPPPIFNLVWGIGMKQ